MIGFNMKELTDFEKELTDLATNTMPRKSKKFLLSEGNKLRKETLKEAKIKFKPKTGNLFKGIKRGKVYVYSGTGAMSVRVYAGGKAKHANLLEYGHRKVNHKGEELGFVEGHHFFEKAMKKFEPEHYDNVQDFIDEMLEDGLC